MYFHPYLDGKRLKISLLCVSTNGTFHKAYNVKKIFVLCIFIEFSKSILDCSVLFSVGLCKNYESDVNLRIQIKKSKIPS